MLKHVFNARILSRMRRWGYLFMFCIAIAAIGLAPAAQAVNHGNVLNYKQVAIEANDLEPAADPQAKNSEDISDDGKGVNERKKTQDKTKCREGSFNFGWAVCSGLDILTRAIDGMTSWIANALKWTIIADTSNNAGKATKKTWQDILAVANITLAIAFLWMLYMYALNSGNVLQAYDAKKLLSRLILVAVAMNLSYYICGALVDLSNIAGVGVYDLIMSQIGMESEAWYSVVLGSVFSLMKGIGIATIALFHAGAIAIAIMVILIAIMVRNVALLVLVIASPLAFACYLLPNTEKWFHKWFDWFFRLLLVFPMFTAAWAASRLVGYVIAGSEINAFSIPATLTALAPPLMIVPIFQAAGGIMGSVTSKSSNFINNSSGGKWLRDRSQQRRELAAQRMSRASINLQNNLQNKGSKTAKAGANIISRINGTRLAAKEDISKAEYDESMQAATNTINAGYIGKKLNNATGDLKDTDMSEVIRIATGEKYADAYHQAAAISYADKEGKLSNDDMLKVLSSARQNGNQQVLNAASNTKYAQDVLGSNGIEHFVKGTDEWKGVSGLSGAQNALTQSIAKNIGDMVKNNNLNAWQSNNHRMYMAQQAGNIGRDLKTLNNIEALNNASLDVINVNILGSNEEQRAEYQNINNSIRNLKTNGTRM